MNFTRTKQRRFARILAKYSLTLVALLPQGSCVGFVPLSFSSPKKLEKIANRTEEQMEYLQETISASVFRECKISPVTLDVPAPVRNARIIWNANKPVLIYEGQFQDSIKTIWQPLNASFELNGAGLVLGLKNESYVQDFATYEDKFKNTWTSFRYKGKGGQIFYGAIEYSAAQKNSSPIQIKIPSSSSDSIQQVWLIPTSQNGIAQVITRSNSATLSVDKSDKVQSTYTWYTVNALRNQIKKSGEFKDLSNRMGNANFLPLEKSNEPVALVVIHAPVDDAATDPKMQRNLFKIVAFRLFSTKEQVQVAESDAPLSSLTVTARNPEEIHTIAAWTKEPEGASSPTIQWAYFRLDTGPNGTFSNTRKSASNSQLPFIALKKIPTTQKSLNLNHVPINLRFRTVPPIKASDPKSVFLSWSTNLDQDLGYVATQVLPTVVEEERIEGRDQKGMIKKVTQPKMFAIYPTNPAGQIVGLSEPLARNQPQVLVIAHRKETNKVTPTALKLCTFDVGY